MADYLPDKTRHNQQLGRKVAWIGWFGRIVVIAFAILLCPTFNMGDGR